MDEEKEKQMLLAISSRTKEEGKRVVAVSGTFDILHAGHVFFLEEAKRQGDILVVFLNSDASVKRYKGAERPIIPQEERIKIITALACVNYSFIFNDDNPNKILEFLKPDVYCNGSEWGTNCIEKDIVEKNGGVLCVIEHQGQSTTDIIKKIQAS